MSTFTELNRLYIKIFLLKICLVDIYVQTLKARTYKVFIAPTASSSQRLLYSLSACPFTFIQVMS